MNVLLVTDKSRTKSKMLYNGSEMYYLLYYIILRTIIFVGDVKNVHYLPNIINSWEWILNYIIINQILCRYKSYRYFKR